MLWLLFAGSAFAHFPSTVEGVSIDNTHFVLKTEGEAYRGAAPTGKYDELEKLGITDYLIFKRQTKTEVDAEIEELRARGIDEKRILHVPMKWKQFSSFKEACRWTIDALAFIDKALGEKDRKVFFHCTVGEDRTGMLAGLLRMLHEEWNARRAFDEEMCAHGYEAGNPEKDSDVAESIRRDMTPVFRKMAYKIAKGYVAVGKLDKKVCGYDPGNEAEFRDSPDFDPKRFACEGSANWVGE